MSRIAKLEEDVKQMKRWSKIDFMDREKFQPELQVSPDPRI